MTDLTLTKSRSRLPMPWVTLSIIAVCAVFLPWSPFLPLDPSVVSSAIWTDHTGLSLAALSSILYLLQHNGPVHFTDNFLIFGFLGTYVEIAVGPKAFIKYLLATGIGAATIFCLTSTNPVVGLSGVTYGLWMTILMAAPLTELAGFKIPSIALGPLTTPAVTLSVRFYAVALVVFANQFVIYSSKVINHIPDHNAYTLHIGSAIMGALLYQLWLKAHFNAFGQTALGRIMMSSNKVDR